LKRHDRYRLIARAVDSLLDGIAELQVINKEVHVVLCANLVPSPAGCQGVVDVVSVRAPHSPTCRATRGFLKGKTYAVPGLLSPVNYAAADTNLVRISPVPLYHPAGAKGSDIINPRRDVSWWLEKESPLTAYRLFKHQNLQEGAVE